ncbi:hypothetical protein HPB52_001641 [Rhipicephalus sanguineus]|uniref:Uncharacterized protein n=1 Tax=Rhipicephalus sanguineus TaxID=34632 RepID=A0A9D4T0R6_RHISA|nr:hypothetical protein HPB52_001641 [Rhipicephalus sanguineus]
MQNFVIPVQSDGRAAGRPKKSATSLKTASTGNVLKPALPSPKPAKDAPLRAVSSAARSADSCQQKGPSARLKGDVEEPGVQRYPGWPGYPRGSTAAARVVLTEVRGPGNGQQALKFDPFKTPSVILEELVVISDTSYMPPRYIAAPQDLRRKHLSSFPGLHGPSETNDDAQKRAVGTTMKRDQIVTMQRVAGCCVFAIIIATVLMTRLLGLFVLWNTLSMLFCCAGNLAGLRYPPKWYTHRDINELTLHERTKLVIFWAPVIIGLAFVKLYYTSLLFEFYKIYKSTSGKAYDGQGLARIACSGRSSRARTPAAAQYEGCTPVGASPWPPQDGVVVPAAGAPASALLTPSGYSQMNSAIAQEGGATAVSSAIASSVTTPRPVTAESSAVVAPKPTAETPTMPSESSALATPKPATETPRAAAHDNVTVAGGKKSKSRASRAKKPAAATADARSAGAGKATAPKIADNRTRPFQPAR